jgi:phosphoheptose isomerase
MPNFIVERYEVHTQKVMVEAKNRAEAILKAVSGEGTDVDNSLEYIESDETRGMSTEELTDEEAERLAHVTDLNGGFIPTIRSAEED